MSKITYEQFCDPAFRRAELIKVKSDATWVAFHELSGLLNLSQFAREYFGKSQSWFAQKVRGYSVHGKRKSFTSEEYHQIAQSFRDIARRLSQAADEIEAAQ